MDAFWAVIDGQIEELKSAKTAADVVRIFATEKNPYGPDSNPHVPAFFAGSGGDYDFLGTLQEAGGWELVWYRAHYYWCAKASDGSFITYVEGDIFPEKQRPL
jgi:hypothetical protein